MSPLMLPGMVKSHASDATAAVGTSQVTFELVCRAPRAYSPAPRAAVADTVGLKLPAAVDALAGSREARYARSRGRERLREAAARDPGSGHTAGLGGHPRLQPCRPHSADPAQRGRPAAATAGRNDRGGRLFPS